MDQDIVLFVFTKVEKPGSILDKTIFRAELRDPCLV